MRFGLKRIDRIGLRLLALVLGAVLLVAAMPADAKRLALVVGNSDYQGVSPLKNPVNDADAMSEKLRQLGFEVTLLQDTGSDEFWTRIDDFSARAQDAESVVFFYSGHAFQLNGINYLVPVEARLTSRESIKTETWSLDSIIARLQARNRQTLIFLDACRNDPLPQSVRGSGAAADGLARLQTGVGTFVAFATEPGAVTYDGAADSANSPFTSALLNHMDAEGISVSDMMIRVRNEVEEKTLRKQTPWDQSSLREQFYFVPEVERKQELSNADYELLAQLEPEDRKKFLELLRLSGFSERSLREAEEAIEVASENLEMAGDGGVAIGAAAPVPETLNETVAAADSPAEDEPAQPTQTAEAEQPETTEETPETGQQVAAAETGDAAETDPDTPQFEMAGETTIIKDDLGGPQDDPGATGEQPVIRLAALGETRNILALNAVLVDRLRVEGSPVQPDTDENKALLESIDPRLVEPEEPELTGKALASAAQTELRRLGCYRMRIDGDWGRGSKTALTSYFLAKKTVPDSLDPSPELLDRLRAEPRVVCKVRVATVGKSAGKTERLTKKQEEIRRVQKRKKAIKKELKLQIGGFN